MLVQCSSKFKIYHHACTCTPIDCGCRILRALLHVYTAVRILRTLLHIYTAVRRRLVLNPCSYAPDMHTTHQILVLTDLRVHVHVPSYCMFVCLGYGWVGYFTFLFFVLCTCTCISMYMYIHIHVQDALVDNIL